MTFKANDRVQWISSCTRKQGLVIAVIPTGQFPDPTFMKREGLGQSRDHETYLVYGGERGARPRYYWPRTSLLEPMGGLNKTEIDWCHAHADEIRELISKS